jgi:hypothetical protein
MPNERRVRLPFGIWPLALTRIPGHLPTKNICDPSYVSTIMTIFKKLFAPKTQVQRVRVCVECGMPVAEHKEWCSIYRTQQEMAAKARAQA